MFEPVTTPDGGLAYWREVLGVKLLPRSERIKRRKQRRRKPRNPQARFRHLVKLAGQDKLASNENTRRSNEGYRAWRQAVMERDGFACVKCGTRKTLEPHHIKGWTEYPSLRLKASNGVTLCPACHGFQHDWLRESPEMQHLKSIVAE